MKLSLEFKFLIVINYFLFFDFLLKYTLFLNYIIAFLSNLKSVCIKIKCLKYILINYFIKLNLLIWLELIENHEILMHII